MPLTRIKICGITDISVALGACKAGADALGFIFHPPSPRHLEIDQAAAIRQALPPFVTPVAVLVNPAREYVTEIVDRVKIDLLQFHGEEEDGFCSGFGRPYIKAIRVTDSVDLVNEEKRYPDCSGILLDTHSNAVYGGSGKSFDWERAKYNGQKPVILAGGLSPENVLEALSIARPFGVDISSGVETDGKKDSKKMASFCTAVRSFN